MNKLPSNKEYADYLAKLQLRNREKRRLEEEDIQKRELEKMERGFNLNWSGANTQKKRDAKKFNPSSDDYSETTAKIKIRRSRPMGYAEMNQVRNEDSSKNVWKQGTVNIKKENGDFEKISPVGSKSPKQSHKPKMFDNEGDNDDEMLFRKRSTRVTLNRNDIDIIRRSLSSIGAEGSIEDSDLTPSTMETLIEKLKRLDQKKQMYLLKVLEKLETSESNLEIDVSEEEELEEPKDDTVAQYSPASVPNTSPIKETTECDTYCLRVLSTWGHATSVGLTEIEFFSFFDTKIDITDSQVNVRGGLGGKGNIMRLFNGKKKTTNDLNMWQTSMPSLSYLEILISVPTTLPVTNIVFWNFNKSVNVSTMMRQFQLVIGKCKRSKRN